ncbi:hypothetical protein [Maribacter sp. 2-571]|uniref:hypothetical protein n=1 Tax=Maribacter sp. 2-571 TaxID=3417569 RepID=UPI003D349F35
MKSFRALFFVMLYLLAMIRPVMPLFEYIVDQDYIAEFLCVNKAKPELTCEGKCFLMQQLSEQSEGQQQNVPSIAMEKYPIGFVFRFDLHLKAAPSPKPKNNIQYRNGYSFLYCGVSFQPPIG